MKDSLEMARAALLDPGEISEARVWDVLGGMLGHQLDVAEVFFQNTRSESRVLEDGIVRDGAFSIDRGTGIRALAGERTGFAYADAIDGQALVAAADAARRISRSGGQGRVGVPSRSQAPTLYAPVDPAASLTEDEKLDLLRRIDSYTRGLDSRVDQVIVSLAGSHDTTLVMASDGTLSADVRPLVRFNVSVIVEQQGRRERGTSGGGGRVDYRHCLAPDWAEAHAREAVRVALVNLEARAAPAGAMPVVLGPGWSGVLLHEAVGHGLEGDFNRKGTSTYSGRMGEQVAAPLCTVVDDGSLPDRRGSLSVDDEGTPTGKTVLIEQGRLCGYMQDRHNAALMGVPRSGNGRRQSYAYPPMPRMTNTYLEAGPHAPEEILQSVTRGLYARSLGGGQVDITSGKFVFNTTEAWMIENGRLTYPVRGATLIGSGPEAMGRVSMVGTDLELDQGVGVCGKDGQSVPVGVGQPTVKVDELVVGGTAS